MSSEKNLYQILFESSNDAILLIRLGQFTECNSSAGNLFDCPREMLLGQTLIDLSPPTQPSGADSARLIKGKIAAALAGEAQRLEWLFKRRGSKAFYGEMTLSRVEVDGQALVQLSIRDITGRKQREKILREVEERLHTVITHAPVVLFAINRDGKFTLSEGKGLEALGLKPGQIVGMSAYDLYDDVPEMKANLQRAMHGEAFAGKVEMGGMVFDSWYLPVHDETGEVTSVIGVSIDITTHRQAEAALRESQRALSTLMSNLPGMAYRCRNDKTRTMEFVSEGCVAFTGYQTVDLIENKVIAYSQLIHPEDQMVVWTKIQIALQERKPFQLIYRIKTALGEEKWVWERGLGVTSPEGNLAALEGFVTDITERKRAEEAIEEQRAFLRQVIDINPQFIFAKDRESRFVLANQALAEAYGTSVEGLIGKSDADFNPNVEEVEHFRRDDLEVINNGTEKFIPEEVITDAAGNVRWLQTLKRPLVTKDGNYLLGVATDITQRKLLEQQVQEVLERRSLQVQLSTQIAQEIAAAPDLGDLYQRVVTLVKEQFGYYHVQLLRYDPDVNAVTLINGYGEVGAQMLASGHRMPIGVGLIGTAAATGESVLRSDVSTDPNWRPNPLLLETRSELAVPIRLGRQVLGVLDVQSEVAGALNVEDQIALEGLCGQIAIAIESTRLRQEMAERLQELNALQRIMSREGWQTFQTMRRDAAHSYFFDQVTVQPVKQSESSKQSNGQGQLEAAFPVMRMPMAVRGEIIGAIAVQDDPNHPLTSEEQGLLASISEQVAEALENARLLEQTQKRAHELETVSQVSAAASTLLQTDKLLQTVVDLTKERLDLYHVSIFLLDEAGETLILRAAAGYDGEQVIAQGQSISLKQKRSVVARAARSRRGLIINDVREASDFRPHTLPPQTCAEMAIPMIVGEKLIGMLDVQSDVANRFTQDDLVIHTTLAAQVAVALQNAELYAEQLETASKLREVDRIKSEFLASMSHELRTPLNSIIGFADVLLEGIDGELTPRMEEDISLIRESGRYLRQLIGDILDMSKIEAGMMELRYEEIDLQQMANELVATSKTLAIDKPIKILLNMEPEVERLYADRTRIMQVLLNLISNAVKFTEKGRIILSLKMQNDHLHVSVKDTGIGIKPEHLSVIFEQFRQVDGSLTRRAGGTGLGLPISKRLVELHDGDMGVESALNQGSTFWFTIPNRPVSVNSDTSPLRTRIDVLSHKKN